MKDHKLSHVLVIAFLVFSAVALLSACSSNQDKPRILLLLKTYDNPFFRSIEQGFSENLQKEIKSNYQVDIRYSTTNGDISSQRQTLETFINKYVTDALIPQLKAVVITPAGSNDELTTQIKTLQDLAIPVVIADAKINKDALARAHTDYTAYVGSNNRQGGALAADILAQRLPKGGNILVFNGPPGHEPAIERHKGFIHELNKLSSKNHSHYDVTERTANWQQSEAREIMDGLLSMGRKFDGIFAANDEMALGAIEALRQAKQTCFIVGFDAIDEAVKAVNDGRMTATISQDAYGIGKNSAQIIAAILNHQQFTKDNPIDVKVVDVKIANAKISHAK